MFWSKCDYILAAAQRKSDSLQDRIDSLEREKEDVEQSLEEAVLQVFSLTNSQKIMIISYWCWLRIRFCCALPQAEMAKAELEEERRMVTLY